MATNINRLLNKKNFNGLELGKLLVNSLLNDISNALNGEDNKPLFTQDEFNQMYRNLKTAVDQRYYGAYVDVYHFLVDSYNKLQGQQQQFFNGYYRYLADIQTATAAEKEKAKFYNYPLVITQKELEDLKRKALERLPYYSESLFSLFFDVLREIRQEDGNIPQELEDIARLDEEAAANCKTFEIAIDNIDYFNLCYLTLPDGTASIGNMDFTNQAVEHFMETHTLTIDGVEQDIQGVKDHYLQEVYIKLLELHYKGTDELKRLYKEATGKTLTEPRAARILTLIGKMLNAAASYFISDYELVEFIKAINLPEFEIYNDLTPHKLTAKKWQEVKHTTNYFVFLGVCTAAYDIDEAGDEEAAENLLNCFKADYPELYNAIMKYLQDKGIDITNYKTLLDYGYYWHELADLDITHYKRSVNDYLTEIPALFPKGSVKARRAETGIAVMQTLGDPADYEQPDTSWNTLYSIEATAADQDRLELIETYTERLIKPALRYLFAYNAVIDYIGLIFELDNIDAAKVNTDYLEQQIQALNGLLYLLHSEAAGITEADRAKTQELIKQVYKPIEIEPLQPDREKLKQQHSGEDRLPKIAEGLDGLIEKIAADGLILKVKEV